MHGNGGNGRVQMTINEIYRPGGASPIMSISRASDMCRHWLSDPLTLFSHYPSIDHRASGNTWETGGPSLKAFRSLWACVLATNRAVICRINTVSHSINACLSPPEVNMIKRNAKSLALRIWMSQALSLCAPHPHPRLSQMSPNLSLQQPLPPSMLKQPDEYTSALVFLFSTKSTHDGMEKEGH